MQKEQKRFGLRNKSNGKILGYYTQPNLADCCVETQYILDTESEQMWLVNEPENAEWVRLNPTEWYNAGYNTPSHSFDDNELEVVSVEININVNSVDIKIPTPYEYFRKKYEKKDPAHWQYLKRELKSGNDIRYAYFELNTHENSSKEN